MPSNFLFLELRYPELFTICELSEKLIHIDPSSSLSKSRLFSEKLSQLIWDFENLGSFEGNQLYRINQLFYLDIIPDIVKELLHTIRKSGNKASHDGSGSYSQALSILRNCYQLARWFYETYEDESFEEIEYKLPIDNQKISIEKLTTQLEKLSQEVVNYNSKIESINATPELIKERKRRSVNNARNIDKTESETRESIDEKLRLAGWECDTKILNFKKNKSLPEKGKNKAIAEWPCDGKWADYALFIGKELYGIVEAKKYSTDISTDLYQSKKYAELIKPHESFIFLGNWDSYKVPFLFSTNGRNYLEQLKTKSGIWFLDIRNNRNQALALKGWFSPQGLIEQYKRNIDIANIRLQDSEYSYLQNSNGLGLRYYQIEAIKAVEDKIIQYPYDKRSLLVMATGTGKTRTTIGLAYRLIKSDRFRRILFLTDRKLLASQALGSFKDNKVEDINTFSNIYKIEEMKNVFPEMETRLHFATVQSMVKRLFYNENPLPIDTYDCIIIDEAHRGYTLDLEISEEDLSFKDENDYIGQYKKVIEYFNAYIIGLTATPALHTTEIFGKPVHNYSYREAVIDGYLIDHEPPYIIKTQLSENGILWEKGEKPKVLNPETNTIEELAELEDELHIEIEQFNKMVITEPFNRAVIKELIQHLDPESDEKTLIFAANNQHADLIVKILYEEYGKIGIDAPNNAIKKLTGIVYEVEKLTTEFKNEKFPCIVVTVDLLTTGIDIPQITNLVFLRRVRSRILFEQMLGRATRLCPEIDKQYFRIFDAVRVYEALQDFTQMKTVTNPSMSFQKLIEELEYIEKPERARLQLEQIVAKLQRKKKDIEDYGLENFMYMTKGETPNDFIRNLLVIENTDIQKVLTGYATLWEFLGTRVSEPKKQFVSDHDDEVIGIKRGYGNAEKPEDYIQSFKKFINENQNVISAIKIICTKPAELDRKSLKELKLLLDQEGFNIPTLNAAWKNVKNQDIAADIISYIRTLALDAVLVSHEDRIKNAINKVKAMKPWNKHQLKWIERFEKQILYEDIFDRDYINQTFREDGGIPRIQKIFNNELEEMIGVLNEHLFTA
ncbi:type I restriction-modification system endonuclease [Chryseobacterium indologenes]|uniref:type I restriction-modification system endonuclease n=1 Tax=Chryseobacterium indologenes TaxID=253 RepID=UPI0009A253A0|nr:type I restriction-modification system endonuclease [Chryseobacterium indologenes]